MADLGACYVRLRSTEDLYGSRKRHRAPIGGTVKLEHVSTTRTFVDEAVAGRKAGTVRLPVVSVKLYDETSLRRVEATLTTRQTTAQFNVGPLRLCDLRPLQVQKQTNVISTPHT